MKKVSCLCLPVIKGFVFCAVVLQIVLGAIYIGSNFSVVPQFRDTSIYLEMAEEFIPDEYTGLLYPGLVKLCSSLGMIPYQIPIYLIQLSLGVFCVYHFVSTWTDRKVVAIICALWVNTIPFVAQAHVTVLPHSLALSFLLLMFLQVLKGMVRHKPLSFTDWGLLMCSFSIIVQLTEEYLWAGALLVLWACILQFYAVSHKVLLCFVSLLISAGILVSNLAVLSSTQHPGYYGRIQNTASSVFFQRVGVVALEGKYFPHLPIEVQQCFQESELKGIRLYPYKVQTEFGPTLEARYGKEEANVLYRQLGNLGLEFATKDNLIAIGKDTLAYALPLANYIAWQSGHNGGATVWNYQQFIQQAPAFSVMYAKVCHFLWLLGFSVSVVMCILRVYRTRKMYWRLWGPVVVYVLVYALLFALRGMDVYDYKLSLLPMVLGYIPLGYVVFRDSLYPFGGEQMR